MSFLLTLFQHARRTAPARKGARLMDVLERALCLTALIKTVDLTEQMECVECVLPVTFATTLDSVNVVTPSVLLALCV
jgi:hypothetical protein